MSFLGKWFDAGARFEKNYAQKFLARYRAMPWPGDWQLDLENQYVDVRGLRVAVAREKRLLITGELGSGKTSAL
ncbi:MAG: hypothetical protein HY070_12730, partial [Chloroflexi bacterium]|nr:hypothetical protein [Chloroflexota bacterium]